MKLRKFNANHESKKLSNRQRREYQVKTRTMILSIGILICSIILCTYAAFKTSGKVDVVHSNVGNLVQDDYTINAFIEGVASNTVPDEDDGYIVDSITCTNGATGTWDDTGWGILITGAEEPTKCNIYFVVKPNINDLITPELYDGYSGKAGLIPVKYNNGNTIVADPDNENEDWFDYEEHKWANAVLVSNYSTYYDSDGELIESTIGTTITESNILQYYVWIPRYRYQLFNTGTGTSVPEQMINIEFETKDTQKSTGTTNGEWLTHPAFTFGSTELNGFWVGKFETSHSNTSTYIDQSTTNRLSCSSTSCSSANGIVILPNKISIVNNSISNCFYVSRSIEGSSTYNLKSDKLDTHLMKNMEWGAVAYLSSSVYGLYDDATTCNNSDNNTNVTINGSSTNRCRIWINNTHTGNMSSSSSGIRMYGGTITGCSAKNGMSDSVQNSMSNCGGTQYAWNGSSNNGRSSTTGNIYGIYDMAGGATEFVMGNQSNSSSTYNWNKGSSGFSSAPNAKYYDKYLASTSSNETSQYRDQKRGLLGDSTRETIKNYGTDNGSWFGNDSVFVSGSSYWFRRGGSYDLGSSSGIFYFSRHSGEAAVDFSFHIVISAEDE